MGARSLLYLILLVSSLARDVLGFSTGAAPAACDDMMPRHNCIGSTCTPAQSSTTPYTVVATTSTYSPGQSITVTLSGSSSFQGFLLQAREAGALTAANPKLGTFSIPPTAETDAKILTCNSASNSVTHTNQNNKNSISVTWTAPSLPHGDIVFRATFAQSKSVFWVGVPSSALRPQMSSRKVTYDEHCKIDKGCFTDCTTPQSPCTFQVSYARHGSDRLAFEMRSSATSYNDQYIAVGFSADEIMADDGVIECVQQGGSTGIYRSVNENGEKETERLGPADVQLGLSAQAVSVADGIIACSFITQLSVSGRATIWDLNKKWILFFAQGPAESDEIEKHGVSPKISLTEVDLTALGFTDAKVKSLALIRAHGSMMIVSWVALMSIGAAVALYYKPVWPDTKILNKPVWFQIHRTCMTLILVFTVIAFIIIFVDVQGFVDEHSGSIPHSILGILVTILVIANVIMSFFRCSPTDSKRPIFNWAHWAVGELAWILAIAAIFLGVSLDRLTEYISAGTIYVVAGFVVYTILFFFGMAIMQWYTTKEDSDSYDMKPVGEPSTDVIHPSAPRARKLEIYLFLVHVVVVLAFAITLIVLINVDAQT